MTRSLQQWSCLFSLDFPVPTVQRLLGWAAQEPTILSTTEQRCLFRRSRKLSGRAAEATEAAAGLARAATGAAVVGPPQLVPATEPRRPASWPAALGPTVAAALAAAVPVAPAGVSTAWERVLAVRAEERAYAALESVAEPVWEGEDLDTLSHLGPEIAPGEIVVAADEVWVRLPKKRALGELRTARVSTPTGYRYLSGTGEAFLRQLLYFLLVCGGRRGLVPLLADGAQWLRWFAATLQAQFPRVEFVLDWFHLKKKCLEKLSMICRGRPATLTQWRALLHRLWRGEVAAALEQWEALRAEGRNEKQLDELLGYLRARETAIPNYQERRLQRRFNGSGQVEKAHDLLVARRQKRRGMHWNLETSDSLAALKTLLLNGGWERYRQEREVLPFVAS